MPSNLTLKQRLAALSIAPSAPSSPRNHQFTAPDSPSLSSPRRKGFNINTFTPPWTKRPSESNSVTNAELEGRELVQETMSKLIFQAGVDYETRPMVVINASALPDPREINYDLLLSRILSYLNLYVESDYTVVFMAAGGKHSPGWNWVWKAYRSLSRKYRKNLKRLYVVHSTFFTKMLFSLAGAIISPKFFRKITYINTLSELAYHVPLTQIDIPPAAYQENLKHEKKINLPVPTPSITFGVPLEDIMGYEGEKGGIPRVVKDTIQFLRDTGLDEEGLFRRSAPSAMLRTAQEAYDRGNVVSLETFGDPHLAAVLLKKYLRDLPTPIFPEPLYMVIRRCPIPTSDPTDMASVIYIREVLLPELPPCAYILLSHVLHLMHEVSLRSASNRMDAHNLTVVLCPNLVSGSSPVRDVQMCGVPGGPALFPQQLSSSSSSLSPSSNPRSPLSPSSSTSNKATPETTLGAIIKLCIQRYYEVFDEVADRTEPVLAYPLGYLHDKSQDSTPERSRSHSRDVSAEPSDDERRPGANGFIRRSSDLPPPSSSLSRPNFHRRQSSGVNTNPDDDEDIDDAMLVMPLGPEHGHPSSGSIPQQQHGASTFRTTRHKNTLSNGSSTRVRSINTDYGVGYGPSSFSLSQSPSYATYSKAKSMISVEKSGTTGPGRKGSISVGRGTNRKSTGSGVAAVGITAGGFFAPPPVPPLPGNISAKARAGAGEGQE